MYDEIMAEAWTNMLYMAADTVLVPTVLELIEHQETWMACGFGKLIALVKIAYMVHLFVFAGSFHKARRKGKVQTCDSMLMSARSLKYSDAKDNISIYVWSEFFAKCVVP
jgi:hypothetical protein